MTLDNLNPLLITQGALVYIADYTPLKRVGNFQPAKCYMVPHIVDRYWMQYIANLGTAEVDPVPVSTQTLEQLDDLTMIDSITVDDGTVFRIDGTQFVIATNQRGADIMLPNCGFNQHVMPVNYIHELQAAYLLITGAALDVSTLLQSMRRYRSPSRDITTSDD